MENKKYELIKDDTITLYYNYKTLYRIKALRDFGNIKAGDLGGYIEKEDNLSHDDNAKVFDDAEVCGNAKVFDDAEVCGNAKVSGDAKVCGNAKVCANAKIYGNAKVSGDVKVYGDAIVYGVANVYGNANVHGDAIVYGVANVYGNTEVYGNANISSNDDYCTIQGFGSKNRVTTFFRIKLGDTYNIGVKCGCFYGTLEEFRQRVIETHKNTYLADEYINISKIVEDRFKNRNVI